MFVATRMDDRARSGVGASIKTMNSNDWNLRAHTINLLFMVALRHWEYPNHA